MALDINAVRARAGRTLKSFTPQQMLILGGLAVVSLIGLVALVRWVSQPSYAVLSSGVSSDQVGKITDALSGEGIAYRLSPNGTTVMVPSGEMAKARLALTSAGVRAGEDGVDGYELLDKQGLTTSDFKQRVDYQRALEGELTRSLMKLDEVDTATVHLSLPEKRLFVDDTEAARASVIVSPSRPLDEAGVKTIMQTIAASVPGLSPDNVTVADVSGQILSAAGMTGGSDAIAMARKYEAAVSAQAQQMLSVIYGPGHALVQVSADMDFDQTETKQTSFDPESATPQSQQQSQEKYSGNGGTVPAGVIGVTGTTLGTVPAGDAQAYERNDVTTNNAINKTETVQRAAPGRIKRLTVAVALDDNLEPKADSAAVQSLVSAAVGFDQARGDVITVQTAPFDKAAADAAEAAQKQAASAESKGKLMGYAQTGGALVVLLLAVLFLRKGLKSREVSVDEVDAKELARSAEPFGVLGGSGGAALAVPRNDESAPGELRLGDREPAAIAGEDRLALDPAAEVLELIDREPDDVAALLRSWVADRRS
jgi:flagellar M-ring protein FliF